MNSYLVQYLVKTTGETKTGTCILGRARGSEDSELFKVHLAFLLQLKLMDLGVAEMGDEIELVSYRRID